MIQLIGMILDLTQTGFFRYSISCSIRQGKARKLDAQFYKALNERQENKNPKFQKNNHQVWAPRFSACLISERQEVADAKSAVPAAPAKTREQ